MCLPILAVGLGVAQMAMGMMGASQQAEAQAQAYEAKKAEYQAQAMLQQRQAQIEGIAAGAQARRADEKLDTLTGRQLNAGAATGLSLEGSLTDILESSRREGMLDIAAIKWNADLKAGNLNYAAATSYMNAAQAGKAAETTRDNAWMGVASAGLSGLSGMMGTNMGGGATLGTSLAKAFG